jgi:hypothetical protein
VSSHPLPGVFEPTYTRMKKGRLKATICSFAEFILLGVMLAACGGVTGSNRAQMSLNLTTAPTSSNFGNVPISTPSAAQIVTLTNNSSGSITVSAITISGPFVYSGATVPVTLNAGQSRTLNVTFTPTTSGAATGTLTITSTAGNSPTTIALSGTGVAATLQLTANQTSVSFSNVTVGSTSSQNVTLTNNSSGSITVSAITISGPFAYSGATVPVTLNAGQTLTLNVTFTSTTSGVATGTLTITSTAGNSPTTIALSGTGVAATLQLTANQTSLSFSNVTVGSTSSQNVTLTNTGNSSVTISQVTVSGAGFGTGGVTPTETLTAGESVALTVIFAPTAAGSVTGSVTIASNATNSPTNISLSGSGVPQTPDATIPSTFFGMHLAYGPTGYSTPILAPIQVGAMGKPPGTNWEFVETARGSYNWNNLDHAVSYASAHNIPIFVSHENVPIWATSDTSTCFLQTGVYHCPAPPSDENTVTTCQGPLQGVNTTDCMWKEFLTSIVNRYKSAGIQTGCSSSNPQCHGVIQMYEGWNEPGGLVMTMGEFVTFETDFLNTVKANDPGAQVCSPAFISPFTPLMNNFFANGGPKTLDCYDFHSNEPAPEGQIADINQFNSILSSNGIDPSTATIYATEAGRWGNCNATLSPPLTPQAYIARIELLYWSNNVKRHYWFAYDSCVSLTDQPTSSTLRPAGIAYGNVESWMVGAAMSAPCAANGTVWTCGLSRPNGYEALAVWDTAGTSTFSVPSQYTQYQDLEGNTQSISGSVTISPEPILLTNGVAP